MLKPILGSRSSEQVFIFLIAREKGHATEIARFFDVDLYSIQNRLDRLENADVLVSRKVGRTRVYEFNPRYPGSHPPLNKIQIMNPEIITS